MRRIVCQFLLKSTVCASLAAVMAAGCVHDRDDLHYVGKKKRETYRDHATDVAFPAIDQTLPSEVSNTAPPHTILETEEIPIREVALAEAIQSALQASDIIRTSAVFLSPGNPLLSNPQNVASTFDPSITASGVLFGNRGVEAALSAFDAQLNASMLWGRNEQIQNNPFFGGGIGGGGVLTQETAAFQASLQKTFANGGVVSVNHNVNYLGTNLPNQLYPSVNTGNVGINYQLPLLAGRGTEFTRIAGPIGQQFGGLTGVSQGVLIARINEDISIANFEQALHVLVRDVENAYWDLYLAYRNYHTAVTAKESALLTWRIADLQLKGGVRTRAEVAQARDQYFATEAASDNARSNIYTAEIRLRRLMGLPTNDGTTLRPLDEPVSAQLVPNWYVSLTEAMTQRVELRTQKWNIKSLKLQLTAARSLVRPQLNFVSGYQVNGFGDDLLGYNNPNPTDNFYGNLVGGNQTGWNLGLQMNWAIGFRAAMAQVRNYELRLAKAQQVLGEQEKEISHELAISFQEVARAYTAAENNMNRLLAARENVKFLEPNIREGTILLDELLRAQLRQAEAEVAYYQSLVEYNQALNDLQYRKGTILQHNSVYLAEGSWCPEAYEDAEHQAEARNHAFDGSHLKEVSPEPFASPSPYGGVYFTNPAAQPPAEPTAVDPGMMPASEVIPQQPPTEPGEASQPVPPPAAEKSPPRPDKDPLLEE